MNYLEDRKWVISLLIFVFVLTSILYLVTELGAIYGVLREADSSASVERDEGVELQPIKRLWAQEEYYILNGVAEFKEEVSYEFEPEAEYLDNDWEYFQATAYCACSICCGPNAQGITASGKPVQANWTVAADPSVLPLGTIIEIEDYGIYEVQDTGSAVNGNIIDIYFDTHQEALNFGRRDIWVRITK